MQVLARGADPRGGAVGARTQARLADEPLPSARGVVDAPAQARAALAQEEEVGHLGIDLGAQLAAVVQAGGQAPCVTSQRWPARAGPASSVHRALLLTAALAAHLVGGAGRVRAAQAPAVRAREALGAVAVAAHSGAGDAGPRRAGLAGRTVRVIQTHGPTPTEAAAAVRTLRVRDAGGRGGGPGTRRARPRTEVQAGPWTSVAPGESSCVSPGLFDCSVAWIDRSGLKHTGETNVEAKRYLQDIGAQVSARLRQEPLHPLVRGVLCALLQRSRAAGAQRRPVPARRDGSLRHRAGAAPHGHDPPLQALRRARTATATAASPARRRCRTPSTGCSATSCAPGASTSSSCCTAPTARAKSTIVDALKRGMEHYSQHARGRALHASTGSSRPRSWSRAPSASASKRRQGDGRAGNLRAPRGRDTSTCGITCELRDHPLFLRAPATSAGKLLEEALKAQAEPSRDDFVLSDYVLEGELCHKCRRIYDGAARRLRRRLPQGAAPRAGRALLRLAPLPGRHGARSSRR